jgi:hypothetical protein
MPDGFLAESEIVPKDDDCRVTLSRPGLGTDRATLP